MTSRRIIFWILLFFTLFVIYDNLLNPLLERLLWDRDTPFVASKKYTNPQGLALPLLIYLTWWIYKWSKPERIEAKKIEQAIEEGIEKQRVQKKAIEKQRIDKERIGKNGYTKLMYLSGYGDIHEIRNQLILSSADINEQEKTGYTALMYASSAGHLKVVELLLGLGADKELTTKKGNNALFFAKNNSHTEIVSILQSGSPATDGDSSLQSNVNHSDESAEQHLISVQQNVAELEKQMNYKARPLSDEEQDKFEAKFRSAVRMKKWPE